MSDESTRLVWEVLNNQTIGAAIGAFLAFALVVVGGRLERWNAKANLKKRVEILMTTMPAKRASIQGELDGLHTGHVSGAPIMRFPADVFKVMQKEALRSLSIDEAIAYDALIYWMQAIDELLRHAEQECHAIVEAVQKGGVPYAKMKAELDRARDFYADARRNIDYLEQFAAAILQGDPKRIQSIAITREETNE